MPLVFSQIPDNQRTPGVLVELEGSNAEAGLPLQPYRILLLGQKEAGGSAAADTLVQVISVEQAADFFGAQSMLAAMFRAYKANDRFTETWAMPLADPAGAASAGTITFGGAPTESRILNLYVGGRKIQVAVDATMTSGAVATAVAAAITADPFVQVAAAVNGGDPDQVDLTAKNLGTAGDQIDVRHSHQVGEKAPAGLTIAIVAMAGGAGVPDLTAAIAAMGETQFNLIAFPYTDATSLAAIEAELVDRFGPQRSIEGVAIACATGTHAALTTLGDGRNSQFVSIMGAPSIPTTPAEIAAAVTAQVAVEGARDPARPFQTLPLFGVLAPSEGDRFTQPERNLLLFDGIATFTVDRSGRSRIERLVTTYQENAQGAPDTTFLDVNTLLTLSFFRFSTRQRLEVRFPRHKLANDGERFGAGQAVVTPKIAKAELVALAREWEERVLLEDVDSFKDLIQVERDGTDANRLNILMVPNLVNQSRLIAVQIGFRL